MLPIVMMWFIFVKILSLKTPTVQVEIWEILFAQLFFECEYLQDSC